jgi:IclR family acetate operon transcriptional repressor
MRKAKLHMQKAANTITSFDELQAELQNIRAQGFAIDEEEWVEGIRNIAVAILDYSGKPTYAISISGPTCRTTKSILLEMQKQFKKAATELSTLHGYHPQPMPAVNQ